MRSNPPANARLRAPGVGGCDSQLPGVSLAGKRVLITMKHVGLNVAADAFMNSAITGTNGGLVLAIADDPGMHSSQNEQDSRYFAQFALIPCLEPRNQQECYDMMFEAFEMSEEHGVPVMVRLVTRIAHSRTAVATREALPRAQAMLSRQGIELEEAEGADPQRALEIDLSWNALLGEATHNLLYRLVTNMFTKLVARLGPLYFNKSRDHESSRQF